MEDLTQTQIQPRTQIGVISHVQIRLNLRGKLNQNWGLYVQFGPVLNSVRINLTRTE